MTSEECSSLVESYLEWLRSEISVRPSDEGCGISTPFLDRHNDHLRFFAQQQNGRVVLNDDGYTASELRSAGIEIENGITRESLKPLLSVFGVSFRGRSLMIESSPDEVGEQIHSYLQAMLALNDLSSFSHLYLQLPGYESYNKEVLVASESARIPTGDDFREGVRNFLVDNKVKFSVVTSLKGLSGITHKVDLAIPKANGTPQRFVRIVPNPTMAAVRPIVFMVADTKGTSLADSHFIVFLNDLEKEVRPDVLRSLQAYRVSTIMWSHRGQDITKLVQ